jgi:fermentation-respiration switch protein FrsA (DUF1100 family)
VDHARTLYARAGEKAELFLIEGAGHRLRADQRAMKKALEWLTRLAFSIQQSAIGSQQKSKKDL